MARVECEVDYTELEDESGVDCRMRDGVVVTCGNCGHSEQSYGQGSGSVKRCLVLLRENCPEGESNFYVED